MMALYLIYYIKGKVFFIICFISLSLISLSPLSLLVSLCMSVSLSRTSDLHNEKHLDQCLLESEAASIVLKFSL